MSNILDFTHSKRSVEKTSEVNGYFEMCWNVSVTFVLSVIYHTSKSEHLGPIPSRLKLPGYGMTQNVLEKFTSINFLILCQDYHFKTHSNGPMWSNFKV